MPDAETTEAREGGEITTSRRWWLNLQIGLGLAGGAIWFVGAMWGQEFLTGVGCGFIASALVLRLGRKSVSAD